MIRGRKESIKARAIDDVSPMPATILVDQIEQILGLKLPYFRDRNDEQKIRLIFSSLEESVALFGYGVCVAELNSYLINMNQRDRALIESAFKMLKQKYLSRRQLAAELIEIAKSEQEPEQFIKMARTMVADYIDWPNNLDTLLTKSDISLVIGEALEEVRKDNCNPSVVDHLQNLQDWYFYERG